MSLDNSTAWLHRAQTEGFAVGAFNANMIEQVHAIVQAAQEECAPVIVQFSHNAIRYMGNGSRMAGLRYVAEMVRVAAESSRVPVILHLDHGHEQDILQALAVGFTSVMFDGSDLPFKENLETTRRLCHAAHEVGASFEAELGEVPRAVGAEITRGEATDPRQVVEFITRTGIDALAVAVGSVHAQRRKEVKLDFALLDAIHAAVDVPLVLHGSSGVLDESIQEGIRRGLCKINVATQCNGAFTNAVRDHLAAHPEDIDPRKYLGPARAAMAAQVRERIRLFGTSGKASEQV